MTELRLAVPFVSSFHVCILWLIEHAWCIKLNLPLNPHPRGTSKRVLHLEQEVSTAFEPRAVGGRGDETSPEPVALWYVPLSWGRKRSQGEEPLWGITGVQA